MILSQRRMKIAVNLHVRLSSAGLKISAFGNAGEDAVKTIWVIMHLGRRGIGHDATAAPALFAEFATGAVPAKIFGREMTVEPEGSFIKPDVPKASLAEIAFHKRIGKGEASFYFAVAGDAA